MSRASGARDVRAVADRLVALPPPVEARLDELEVELAGLAAESRGPASATARHVLETGGKRVRPILCLLAGEACAPDRRHPGLVGMAQAAELIHAASLLHDDVIDGGEWRRGRVAARMIYGNAASVLGGNLLVVRALELVERSGVPGLMQSTLRLLRGMVEAESLQMASRGRMSISEREYLGIVDGKTASVFAWSAEAGARVVAAAPEATGSLMRFGRQLGIAFQIVDDLLDLVPETAARGRFVWQDLQTGTLTHPLLHVAQRAPDRLAALLAERAQDRAELTREVRALAEDTGALEASRREVSRRTDDALEALKALPGSPARDALALLARQFAGRFP